MKNVKIELAMVREACRVLYNMGEPTTYDNIAKFIGINKMVLLRFLDANAVLLKMRDRKIGRTVKRCIEEVYLDLSEKPGTAEWLHRQRIENANCIELKTIDNYGYFIAYSLEVDTSEQQIYNTPEKVNYIASQLNLEPPGWKYTIGGFGDCATYSAKGYKVRAEHLPLIEQLGFRYKAGTIRL